MAKYSLDGKYDDLDELYEQSELDAELIEDKHIITYRTKTIKSGKVLECEIYPVWDTSKATARARKFRESRKAQKKLNATNATKNVIRLINTNFTDADIWGTFTYETKKLPATVELAQKEFAKFIRRLKYYAARNGFPPLKYVYVTEFEENEEKGKKRVHHHIVTNFPDRDIAERLWRNGARTQTRRLQADESGYEGLCRYIMKDPRGTKRYVTSKNLKKPSVSVSDCKFTRRKIRRIVNGDANPQAVFEKAYKGRYRFTAFTVKTSEYTTGVYLYAKMIEKENAGGRKNEIHRE